MEAQQCVKLTGTKCPFGLTFGRLFLERSVYLHACARSLLPASTSRPLWSVATVQRTHPFPYRTRKLSSETPMVLPGKPGGRVGYRRPSLRHPEAHKPRGVVRWGLAPRRASANCAPVLSADDRRRARSQWSRHLVNLDLARLRLRLGTVQPSTLRCPRRSRWAPFLLIPFICLGV